MSSFSAVSGIGDHDSRLGAARLRIDEVGDVGDAAGEDPVWVGVHAHNARPYPPAPS